MTSIVSLGDLPDDIINLISEFLDSTPLCLLQLGAIKTSWFHLFSHDDHWKPVITRQYPWISHDIITNNHKTVFLCVKAHLSTVRRTDRPNWNDSHLNLVVLGDKQVGKTCLINMFANDIFESLYDPTIEESYRKSIVVDDKLVTIDIMDYLEFYDGTSHRTIFQRRGDGFLLCFDLSKPNTLDYCERTCEEIVKTKEKDSSVEEMKSIPMILVGCKSDLNDLLIGKEDRDAVKRMNEIYGVDYIETSAKNKLNVEVVFERLVRRVKSGTIPVDSLLKMMDGSILLSSYKKPDTGPDKKPHQKKMCLTM